MTGIANVTIGALLSRLAETQPDAQALVYPERPRYTFAELEREARRMARGFRARGLGPGDRVVVWATNVPEWVVLQFALAKIGAILVTANTALRARDIDYLLRHSEAAALITIRGVRDLSYLDALSAIGADRGAIPGLKHLVLIDRAEDAACDRPFGYLSYDEVRDGGAAVEEGALDDLARRIDPDTVINMQYTSGTTGFPKGVMLSSRNIVNNGHAMGGLLGYTAADRLCLCVPLFHCFGCVIGVLGAYTHGACLCPVETFDPERVLQTVEREQCTALYGVPTMFMAELDHPRFRDYDVSSLRTGIMAGSVCPEPLMRRVITDMHMPEITIAYGLTEASPGITMTPRDCSVADRSGTVGVALPDLEVQIVDPGTRQPLPVGERGELRARGYNVMKGYYNNPDATRAVIDEQGWLYTGDQASVDERGFVRITGRIKDLIIRGGENIAPAEIEDCLREHPDVADASVYGLPDEFFGEVVAAAVRARSDAVDPAALVAWCGDHLARFKVPRYVRVVDAFPLTASGKVQKFRLREEHQKILAS